MRIRAPDDFHVHLRDGRMLDLVLPSTSDTFARALVMPNLDPPVVTSADARAYRERIMSCLPETSGFTPLMTLYLTDATDPRDVELAISSDIITAVKLYPAGATTNSTHGITDYQGMADVLKVLSDSRTPLCIHGEDPDPGCDIFDREKAFIDGPLDRIRQANPDLCIVLEHITTRDAISYVRQHRGRTAATITVHHLVLNRNDLLAGGIRPHNYCLPVAKREEHRNELVKAATSGDTCFFLGTDSAPHMRASKESACGCAGIFTSPVALPILATVFDAHGALDRLEGFTSCHGAGFYGLVPNASHLVMQRVEPFARGPVIGDGSHEVVIFSPDFMLEWIVTGDLE